MADGARRRQDECIAEPWQAPALPLLFSYGTLQQDSVQLATFGRLLRGRPDALVGFSLSQVAIEDPEVVRISGSGHHPIVHPISDAQARVNGTVFEISEAELAQADLYEVAAYVRVEARLASGGLVWVYVAAPEL